jgi:hypothetical protein
VLGRHSLATGALLLLAVVVLVGCGSGDDGAPADGGASIVAAQTDLDISFWPEGKDAGEPQRYALTCPGPSVDGPSGDHPDPKAACDVVYKLSAADFEPVPPDAVCTEIYGGPQQARLEGTFAGDDVVPVALDLSRENGCQIELWDRFAGIVPAATT